MKFAIGQKVINVIKNTFRKEKIIRLNKASCKFIKKEEPCFFQKDDFQTSDIPLDVIIPTCTKDVNKLKLVLEAIRENIKHPINAIYIVSPRGICEKFCSDNGCTYVDEDTVLPIKISDINYNPNGKNRSGWIFQQLLKFSADTIAKSDYILIVDSDTIFSSPQVFIQNNKMILNCSNEYHAPYFETMSKLTGLNKRFKLSFVSHHILFNRRTLKELKELIEKNNNKTWWKAIIDSLNPNEGSSFSEYECYGNYMYFAHRNLIDLRYWYNLSTKYVDFLKLTPKDKRKYKTISMHSYNENTSA